jgi:hypothetical protein
MKRLLLIPMLLLASPTTSQASVPRDNVDQLLREAVSGNTALEVEGLESGPAVSAAPAAAMPTVLAAEVAPAPGPSFLAEAASFIGDHLGGLVGLLGLLFSTPFVASHLDAKRKRQIALAVYHGYHIAADTDAELAPGGAKSTADKITAVLKAADDFMRANGWRPIKGDDTASDTAAALVKSLAGQAKVAVDATTKAPAVP